MISDGYTPLHVQLAQTTAKLNALARACANVAAEHERFKTLGWPVYPVHADSMRAIASAHSKAVTP